MKHFETRLNVKAIRAANDNWLVNANKPIDEHPPQEDYGDISNEQQQNIKIFQKI